MRDFTCMYLKTIIIIRSSSLLRRSLFQVILSMFGPICRYQGKWLLTEHEDRGYEFPGGKVEPNEEADQAAIREIQEETGAVVRELTYIGQYQVLGREKVIVKNIYFADIERLVKQDTYFETKGPVLFADLPRSIAKNKNFSFIMKDDVLRQSLAYLEKNGLIR